MEKEICGVRGVDISVLQYNTEYDDGILPCDAHIIFLWCTYSLFKLFHIVSPRETLHSFTDDECSAFLRFVWARTRLPPGSKNLHQKFKIQVQQK